ncbi:MAG: translocation/assembly module TamB domain-containing protein, partial [Candidatus Aminicenantes bacterium]|nr:translocation/assembly module TamB domain-containing protein [Candidatus Aminicenantes bacterium]
MVRPRFLLGLLLSVLLAAASIYAVSLKLDAWVKAWVVERLERQFSLLVEVGQTRVHLLHTRLEIHDLRLFNRAYPGTEPAFESDHISLDFSFTHFFLPEISLDDVRLDSPRIRLLTDPDRRSDLSNLFRISGADPTPPLSPTRLGIKHLTISQGLLLVEQNPVFIQSSEGAVTSELRYLPESGTYRGRTSFTSLDLSINGVDVEDMSVLVDFEWAHDNVRIHSFQVDSEGLGLQAHGDVSLKGAVTYSLDGRASLNLEELAKVDFPYRPRRGRLSLNGNVSGRGTDFSFRGEARSDEIVLSGLSFQQLDAAFRLDPDAASIGSLEAGFEGGRLEGSGTLSWNPQRHSEFQVAGSRIRFRRLAILLGLQDIPARGTFDLSARIQWPALQWRQMKGTANLAYRGNISAGDPPDLPAVRFEGHSRVAFREGTAQFSRGVLRTPESHASYHGHIGLRGGYRFDLDIGSEQSGDLLRLAGLSALLERYLNRDFVDIQGSTQASVRLQSAQPRLEGSLRIRDVHIRQELLGDFQSDVGFDGEVLEFTNARVTGPGFRLQTRLRVTPSTGEISWLEAVELRLEDVPIERFLSMTERKIPLRGRASGRLRLGPAVSQGFTGRGEITLLELRAYGEHVDRLSSEIRFDGRRLLLDGFRATLGRGNLSGRIQIDLDDLTGTASLAGSRISLDEIQSIRQVLPLRGEVDFDLHTQGHFMSPDFQLRLTGDKVVIADRVVEDLQLQAESDRKVVRFRLIHTFLENPFRVEGRLDRREPYTLQAGAELKEVPLKPCLDLLSPETLSAVDGILTGRLTVAGPLLDPARLDVQAELSDVTLSLSGYELRNRSPLQLAYSHPTLQVSPFRLRGERTDLQIGGRLDLGESKSVNLEITGPVNLVASNTFLPAGAVAGQLRLQALISGPLGSPRILGSAQVEDGLLNHPGLPTALFDVAGQFRFTANQVALDNFSARTAYGPVGLEGGIFLEGLLPVRWQIHLLAEGLRVEYPPQTVSILDVDVDLVRSGLQDLVSGNVRIASADYTEDVSVGQLLSLYARSETETTPPAGGNDVKLAVAVEGQQSLQVRNNLIDAVGSVNLNVRGTLSNPVMLGTITVNEGRLFFENNEYEITRGLVLFNNPRRTQPTWNVEAQTQVRDISVTASVRGSFDQLRLSLSSDPPLPSPLILSLLTVGQTPEEILGTSGHTYPQIGNLAVFGAGTVLSKGLADPLASRTSRLLGLEQFSVDPFLFGSERDPAARITLGKQLGRALSLNYSMDLGNTSQGQIVVFEYR